MKPIEHTPLTVREAADVLIGHLRHAASFAAQRRFDAAVAHGAAANKAVDDYITACKVNRLKLDAAEGLLKVARAVAGGGWYAYSQRGDPPGVMSGRRCTICNKSWDARGNWIHKPGCASLLAYDAIAAYEAACKGESDGQD